MSEPDSSAITEVVPQVSYDIIGRIIPGIIVIFSLITTVLGPTQALAQIDAWVIHPDPPLSGWAAVLFVIAGYVLAVILAGIWYFLKPLLRLGKKKDKDADKKYQPDLKDPPFALQYDAIREKSPKAGARIVKLSAELQRKSVQDHWLILQCDQWLMSTRPSSATSEGSEREASVRSE